MHYDLLIHLYSSSFNRIPLLPFSLLFLTPSYFPVLIPLITLVPFTQPCLTPSPFPLLISPPDSSPSAPLFLSFVLPNYFHFSFSFHSVSPFPLSLPQSPVPLSFHPPLSSLTPSFLPCSPFSLLPYPHSSLLQPFFPIPYLLIPFSLFASFTPFSYVLSRNLPPSYFLFLPSSYPLRFLFSRLSSLLPSFLLTPL